MLHELDEELLERGHRFVRYADDCSIYVKSEKSALRVQESITQYIEGELKLKVNREKTQISYPTKSTLLGFSFFQKAGKWEIRISPKSLKRIKEKIKGKTKRNDPSTAKEKIKRMEAVIRGWVNYFSIAQAKHNMQELDEMTRTRLRIGIWKQWKLPRTRSKNLLKLGTSKGKAYLWGNSSLGYCRVAHSPILMTTLTKEYFQRLRYVGFSYHYYWQTDYRKKLF
jgi:RNA-directed DNA polymerase